MLKREQRKQFLTFLPVAGTQMHNAVTSAVLPHKQLINTNDS